MQTQRKSRAHIVDQFFSRPCLSCRKKEVEFSKSIIEQRVLILAGFFKHHYAKLTMLKIQLQLFLFLGDRNMYGLNELDTDSLCMEISEEKIEEN